MARWCATPPWTPQRPLALLPRRPPPHAATPPLTELVLQSAETEPNFVNNWPPNQAGEKKSNARSCDGYLQELEVLRADVMSKERAREEAMDDSQDARSELETLCRRLSELGDAVLIPGERRSLLKKGGDDLSAISDLIASMHLGGCQIIKAFSGCLLDPALNSNFLEELSRTPELVEEVNKSSCQKDMIQALTLCKVYHPSMDPGKLALGFPQFRADGSKYKFDDYCWLAKDVRRHATGIADELKLDVFEPGYDENNRRRLILATKAVSLKVVGGVLTIRSSAVTGKVAGDVGRGKSILPLSDASLV